MSTLKTILVDHKATDHDRSDCSTCIIDDLQAQRDALLEAAKRIREAGDRLIDATACQCDFYKLDHKDNLCPRCEFAQTLNEMDNLTQEQVPA